MVNIDKESSRMKLNIFHELQIIIKFYNLLLFVEMGTNFRVGIMFMSGKHDSRFFKTRRNIRGFRNLSLTYLGLFQYTHCSL